MKVLTVFAHAGSGSFCHAVLDRFDAGLRDAGHLNEVVDLYARLYEALKKTYFNSMNFGSMVIKTYSPAV